MFTEANAALQSLKVINDWISANKSLKNFNEIVSAVYEVNSKLSSSIKEIGQLRDENAFLINKLNELQEKIANKEAFDLEIACYTLHNLESGMIVYKIKAEHDNPEKPTYICTACARNKEIVFMDLRLNGTRLICDSCKKNVDTGWKPGSHKTPK